MARFDCKKFMEQVRYQAGESCKPAGFGSILRSAFMDSGGVFLPKAYAYFLCRQNDQVGVEYYSAWYSHIPGRLYICLSLFLSPECSMQPEWLRRYMERRRAQRKK